MKVLGLDIYKAANCKINKDVNGGFGTVNDYGYSRRGRLLAKLQKKGVDFPPLYLMSSLSVLASQGHDCHYSRAIEDDLQSYALVVVSSSIVCCESELEAIRAVVAKGVPCLAIGPFASQLSDLYQSAGASVLIGEPDLHILNHPDFPAELLKCSKPQIFKQDPSEPSDLNDLPPIRWDLYLKKYTSTKIGRAHV